MPPFVPTAVADLAGDVRNPRVITKRELERLKSSIDRWGDLSGVVFNVHTRELISGHQRLKTLEGRKTKLVRHEQEKDKHGTVATGYVMYKNDEGSVVRIPYREVDWTSKEAQWAANIAANASGGSFDQAKLGAILADLETAQFDIEHTNLDKWEARMALRRNTVEKFKEEEEAEEEDDGYEGYDDEPEPAVKKKKPKVKAEEDDADDDDDVGESPKVYSPDTSFQCECPRCGFRWTPAKQDKSRGMDSLPSERTLMRRKAKAQAKE